MTLESRLIVLDGKETQLTLSFRWSRDAGGSPLTLRSAAGPGRDGHGWLVCRLLLRDSVRPALAGCWSWRAEACNGRIQQDIWSRASGCCWTRPLQVFELRQFATDRRIDKLSQQQRLLLIPSVSIFYLRHVAWENRSPRASSSREKEKKLEQRI